MPFRIFAKRSAWKKARISRELGVSLSTVDRWLDGHDKIMLASMLEIRRFLEERAQHDFLDHRSQRDLLTESSTTGTTFRDNWRHFLRLTSPEVGHHIGDGARHYALSKGLELRQKSGRLKNS